VLGLPDTTRACLFDLDGVVTKTALVHAAAWKEMFDDFLRRYDAQTGAAFVPFDAVHEYDRYVDGKPRLDGTRSFLQARGIELPEGEPSDPPTAMTVNGLSNRKNALVLEMIDKHGVQVYDGSVRYITAVRAAGLKTAVVSSSANTAQVLSVAGIAGAQATSKTYGFVPHAAFFSLEAKTDNVVDPQVFVADAAAPAATGP